MEKELIERIQRLAPRATASLIQGIGDDCAVLRVRPGHDLLVTTDLCVEGIHFCRPWHPPQSVGHRCLARGLSDMAAMGGEPLACFLSLALPPKLPQRWVDGFLQGLRRLARQFKISLAGGDISAAPEPNPQHSPKITADIVVVGQIPAGQSALRSGARHGDRIYVTGELGGSAAVLKRLFAGEHIRPTPASNCHFYPQPRIEVGRRLRCQGLAASMIDLSDGLSVDLGHICRESGVAATIHAPALPIAPGASLELALHGGEDYELLFTARGKAKVPGKIAGVKITEIGLVAATRRRKDYRAAIKILGENGKERILARRGWQHFHRQ